MKGRKTKPQIIYIADELQILSELIDRFKNYLQLNILTVTFTS